VTTLEEAKRCPRCEEPGEHVAAEDRALRSIRGAKVIKIYCRNQRCKWYNTPWTIQVNSNGTIPLALLNRDKKFPKLPNRGNSVVENLTRQVELETKTGGAEINNPNG